MDATTETQHRQSTNTNTNTNASNSTGNGARKAGRSPPPGGAALKPEPWICNGSGNGEYGQWTLPASAPSAVPWSAGFRGDSPSPLKIRSGSPTVQRGKVLANRDKESLLEEIISLKKALHEQTQALKVQKIHSVYVEAENRKLEKDLEELELHGNVKASRTGNTSRLRSKLQGLKTRLADLQATCESQQEELFSLRRDLRITRIREVETERDLYAEEIGRLQKLVKRLKALHIRLSNENKQLSRFRDRTAQLDITNQRLESAIAVMQENLHKSNKEVLEYRQKANGYKLRTKKCGRKSQEIEEQNLMLEKLVEDERALKHKLENKVNELRVELQNIRSHLVKSGHRFEGVDVSDIVSMSDYSEDWRSSVRGSMKLCKSYPVLHEQKNYSSEDEDEGKYTAEACSQGISKSSPGNREIECQDVKESSQAYSAKVADDTVCGAGAPAKGHIVVPKLNLGQVNTESLSGDPSRKCSTNDYESSTYSTTDTEDVGYDSGLEMVIRPKDMSVVYSSAENANSKTLNSFDEKVITENDGKGNSSNKEDKSHTANEADEHFSSSNQEGEEIHISETRQVSTESVHESVGPVMDIGKHEVDNQMIPNSLAPIYSPGEYAKPEPSDLPSSRRKLSLESTVRKLSLESAAGELSPESNTRRLSLESTARKLSLESATGEFSSESNTRKLSLESTIGELSPESNTRKLSLESTTGKLSLESNIGARHSVSTHEYAENATYNSEINQVNTDSMHESVSLVMAIEKHEDDNQIIPNSLPAIYSPGEYAKAESCDSPKSCGKLSPESTTEKLSLASTTEKLSLESTTGKLSPESTTKKLSPESTSTTGVSDSVPTHEYSENATYSPNINNPQKLSFNNNSREKERITDGEQSESPVSYITRSPSVSTHDNAESTDHSSHIQKLELNNNDIEEEIDSNGEKSESAEPITRSSLFATHDNTQDIDYNHNINNNQTMFNNDDIEEEIDGIEEQSERHLHLNPGRNDMEILESNNFGSDHPVPCSVEESDQNRSRASLSHPNAVHFLTDEHNERKPGVRSVDTPCCVTWRL